MIYFLLGFLLALFLWFIFYLVARFNPIVETGYKNSICYGINVSNTSSVQPTNIQPTETT